MRKALALSSGDFRQTKCEAPYQTSVIADDSRNNVCPVPPLV